MSEEVKIKKYIEEELLKCKKDPIYFFKNYMMIQHPMRGRIKFDLYPFQEKVLIDLNDNQYNIILKSRQLGISTLAAGMSLWSILFKSDFNILIIATKVKIAKNLVAKVQFAYDNLPTWLINALGVKHTEFNKLSLGLSNGSMIQAASAASDDSRSLALSMLIIDECAFVKNVEEVWASAQSTLSTGGKAIILSTPNGQGGFFHSTWMSAIDGINGFNPIKLDWRVHPDRDQVWRDEQTAKLGEKMAAQECDASFLTSGNTLVNGKLLTWYEENTILEPIRKIYQDKLWQFTEFESTKKYLIPVDVSRGDGSDFSAFHIIDIETLEQVADFKAKVPVKELVEILIEVGLSWNSAIISVENASMGWGVIQDLIEKEYPNLYYSPKRDVIDEYEYLDESQFTAGFTNSMKTRPLIIAKLEEVINNKMLIIRSQRTINELKVFIWLNHKAQAQQGYNDDLILALAQGCYLRETALRQSYASRFLDTAAGSDFYTDATPVFNSRDKSRRNQQTYSRNNRLMGLS